MNQMRETQLPPLKVAFFSHDSQGLGHFRRNRALAHSMAQQLPALTGRSVTGLLINGMGASDGISMRMPAGFDILSIPAIGKSTDGYGARHLEMGLGPVTSLRGTIVQAALEEFGPDLVVVDRHAFGVARELRPALKNLRKAHPDTKLVLGLREVLDDPATVAKEWGQLPVRQIAKLYDEIWIYGDQRVHDLRTSGELPGQLNELVRYQGYLAHGRATDDDGLNTERPYFITTAGGGSDGLAICLAAAQAEVPTGYRQVIVTGPQMSDADHASVVDATRSDRTRVVHSVSDVSSLITHSAASISMAGYNTTCETLATSVPALLIPREVPRTEQLIRASGLARVGAVEMMRNDEVSPAAITAWWHSVAGTRVDRSWLQLDGLARVPHSAAELTGSLTDSHIFVKEHAHAV